MPLTPSNLFMNWSSVTVVYGATPTTITLTGVTNVEIDGKSQQQVFYGDARAFPRKIRNTQKTRKVTIHGGDVAKLLSIPEDTPCTITAVLDDVDNGHAAGSGALQ